MGVIIAVVFTVTITETIQISEGLAASGDKMIYQLNPGESKMLTWLVINDEDKPLAVEFYATGPGSELLIFEEYLTMDPKTRERYEIFVSVPEEHETDVEYRPSLYVLTRGEKLEGAGAGIVMNMQMRTNPIIKIGDNPIFTPSVVVKEIEEEETPTPVIPEVKTVKEKEIVETLKEKLERIKAANEITKTPETLPITSPVVEKIVTSTTQYEEEPESISAPIVKSSTTIETIKECNFIEVILSWFGMGKC